MTEEEQELTKRLKDLESEVQSLKHRNEVLEKQHISNIKSCKNNSNSIMILSIGLIFLSIGIWLVKFG